MRAHRRYFGRRCDEGNKLLTGETPLLTNPVYEKDGISRWWGLPGLGLLSLFVPAVGLGAEYWWSAASQPIVRFAIHAASIGIYVAVLWLALYIRRAGASKAVECVLFLIGAVPANLLVVGVVLEGRTPQMGWESVGVAIACDICACTYLICWQPEMRRPYSCSRCGYDLHLYREQSSVVCPECGEEH